MGKEKKEGGGEEVGRTEWGETGGVEKMRDSGRGGGDKGEEEKKIIGSKENKRNKKEGQERRGRKGRKKR